MVALLLVRQANGSKGSRTRARLWLSAQVCRLISGVDKSCNHNPYFSELQWFECAAAVRQPIPEYQTGSLRSRRWTFDLKLAEGS